MHDSAETIASVYQNMQNDVENIKLWCDENKMKINELKTKSMMIGSRQKLAKLPDNNVHMHLKTGPR